jgi:hypothetical protein
MARPMHAAKMAPNKNLDIFQSIDFWKISDAKKKLFEKKTFD